MLSFTAQPLEIVPPFFVRKKNGRLRLILDCRAVNLRFKRPPPLALGAGTSWAQVSLPVGEKLFVAQSDIKDYFYSLALPAELQRYFCMPAVSLSMLQALGISDDLDMHCDSEGLVFPMLRVIPMGGRGPCGFHRESTSISVWRHRALIYREWWWKAKLLQTYQMVKSF